MVNFKAKYLYRGYFMRINDIIFEDTTKQVTVFYGGRFQPMHRGHYDVYQHLVNKFGADNVFIVTTFSKDAEKEHLAGNYSSNPFTFDEKKTIMVKMFGVPADKVVQANPYSAKPSAVGRKDDESATVLVYGEKDANRLSTGGYFSPYPDDSTSPLIPASEDRAYVYVAPLMQGGMSASDFRGVMASDAEASEKEVAFKSFFGKYDEEVFKFIEDRLRG